MSFDLALFFLKQTVLIEHVLSNSPQNVSDQLWLMSCIKSDVFITDYFDLFVFAVDSVVIWWIMFSPDMNDSLRLTALKIMY